MAGGNRDAVFLGVAVPSGRDVAPSSDLVAIWRTTAGERFQNYRAVFTILDVGTVPRGWLAELQGGAALGELCPGPFRRFVEQGAYVPLQAPRTIEYRTPLDQQPASDHDRALLQAIYEHCAPDPHAFEPCAIELWKMAANEAVSFIEGTRRSADGGRDAVGRYSIGPAADPSTLTSALKPSATRPEIKQASAMSRG